MSTYSGGVPDTNDVVASAVTFNTPWPSHWPIPKSPAGGGEFNNDQMMMMMQGGNQQNKTYISNIIKL